MAKVEFRQGERQELHGTFGGMVYRYTYGKQRVHTQPAPELPENASKEQLEKHEKETSVQLCVAQIQLTAFSQGAQTVARMQEIADKYPAIKKAVERMYEDFKKYFRHSKSGLEEAIVYWYCYKRLAPKLDLFKDELPKEYR